MPSTSPLMRNKWLYLILFGVASQLHVIYVTLKFSLTAQCTCYTPHCRTSGRLSRAIQRGVALMLAACAASSLPSLTTYYTLHPVGPICLRAQACDIPCPQTA